MPKYFLNIAIVAGLCVASVAVFAAGPSPTPTPAQIQLRYDQLRTAFAARDPVAIKQLLAPGFKSVDVSGQVQDSDQMLGELLAAPQDPKRTSETTVISVAPDGEALNVTQRYHMAVSKQGPDGVPHVVDLVTSSQDRWVLLNGSWVLQATATRSIDYSVDGKVVAHKTAGAPATSGGA
ncbi:nuclear transport factor 2 family protein [Cognatilysobacter lacus]|uniref:Nuclear transport factor 2 family protein n=1 Tax=Cognatilysobacter lacus TaxID=1643323 RepID=A0A5D8YBG2_9GAMM|nr:nuclear transport factor 2 family protein [Lysobacter lacus]TZF79856.1 nuclear transport factor 2 family protein [Lysobacter lacus]